MILAINLLLFILQILVCFKCVKSLKNHFLNFGVLIYLLYFVFSIPIFWDIYFDLGVFEYVYKIVAEYNIVVNDLILTYFNFVSFLIHALFFFGYDSVKIIDNSNYIINQNEKRYKIVMIILGGILGLLLINSIIRYGDNILLYFSLSSKQIYGSFYEKYLIMTIPYIMLTLKVLHNILKYKKLKKSTIIFVLLLFLVTCSTGQRREVISAFIYCGLLLLSVSGKDFNVNRFSKKIVILGVSSILLIAVTWYGRGIFSQIQNGDDVDMPWETRGVVEVIFGSSSTSYPTTLALHNFYKDEGLPYLRQVKYFVQSFIPRAIYKNKLISITELIQIESKAESNLSLFYINDLYFTFGIFSILISFLIGKLFAYVYKNFLYKDNYISKCYSYIIFSLIILFYKNGFVEFLIRFLFVYILMKICIDLVFKKVNNKDCIVVIGNFGKNGRLNGQTARTRTVYNSINKLCNFDNIYKIDTSKKHIKNFFNMFKYIINCKNIVIMPAQRTVIPLILILKFLKKSKDTTYVVIGGWLYEKVKDKKIIYSELNKFKGLLVQVEELKVNLEKLGIRNINVFPNYRCEKYKLSTKKYKNKFVFYSRVREDKGIFIAIDAIEKIRDIDGIDVYLDIYGPIDDNFDDTFKQYIKGKKFVKYCGILNNEKIVNVLSKYEALLFPTYYDGEGFPGAVLEAFLSGLPILASSWKYNKDLVIHGKNGYIHETKNVIQLSDNVKLIINNRKKSNEIRENNLMEAKKYTEDNVFPILKKLINK